MFTYNTVTGGDGGYSDYSSSSGGVATGGALNGNGAISRSTFTGNSATPGFAHGGSDSFPSQTFGGAIEFDGTISESAFSSNSAQYGGALSLVPDLFEHGVTAVVTGCFFQNNSASIAGGVAYVGGYSGTYGDLSITNCTISACTAPDGAVIYSRGVASLVNCTLDGNNSFADGAGSLEIQSDMSYRAPGPISLTNSIIKTGADGANVAPDGIISLGHNISSDSAAGLLTATGDLPNTDPGFVSDTPQDNGGHTKTIAINSLSPAINAGDDSAAPHRDQRGLLRTAHSDIGAYEYSGSLVGLSSITLSGSDVTVSAEVVYGHRYQLEWKSNLTNAEWVYAGYDFIAADNDIESATGYGYVISLGDAFYRIKATN